MRKKTEKLKILGLPECNLKIDLILFWHIVVTEAQLRGSAIYKLAVRIAINGSKHCRPICVECVSDRPTCLFERPTDIPSSYTDDSAIVRLGPSLRSKSRWFESHLWLFFLSAKCYPLIKVYFNSLYFVVMRVWPVTLRTSDLFPSLQKN